MYTEQLLEKEIELIGSASSLVAAKFIKDFPEVLDRDMAYFLAAPIALDTYFFDEGLKGTKWTDKDLQVYQHL